MTRIMVTGTREGMTISQWAEFGDEVVTRFVPFAGPHEFHDGDCIGADSQAHETVRDLQAQDVDVTLHGHPCDLENYRAGNEYDVLYEIKPPIDRNHDMVDATDLVIATPKDYKEVLRSGTWSTIRYARLMKKHLIIIWPDGTTTTEENR